MLIVGNHAGAGAGVGSRAARALRVLLLLVLALGAVEYIVFSILDTSPLKTYLYVPANTSLRNPDNISTHWPKPNANAIYSETPTINKTITNEIQNASLKTPIILLKMHPNSSYKSNRSSITSTVEAGTSTIMTVINRLRTKAGENHVDKDGKLTDYPDYKLPLCDEMPPDLGPVDVNMEEVELDWIEKKYPEVQAGGIYYPQHCTARHRVAIIVPYRDREQHLAIFLRHMHPFLMKQQIHYGIFIVEQEGDRAFNRAKLMNVGFTESQRLNPGVWQCFVFHDIDLLPMDQRNLYSCPRQPRHMSAAIDKFHFKLPYLDIFGGVSALTLDQFLKVNGFSNRYWGWGGEDDDMSFRLRRADFHIARYKMSIARYAMLHHDPAEKNPKSLNERFHSLKSMKKHNQKSPAEREIENLKWTTFGILVGERTRTKFAYRVNYTRRWQLLAQTHKAFRDDGLSNLRYGLVDVYLRHLFTHIVVNIDDTS